MSATTVDTAEAVKTITAEVLTREAFAPFGEILTLEGEDRLPIDLYGDRIDVFRPALIHADTPIEWLLVRSRIREFRVHFLERHEDLAQAFIPLAGHPFVSVVAAPDAREENGLPAFDEVHAFLVPGDRGIQIHKRTWHEPPFPLTDGGLCLITSHQALTAGLGSKLDEKREIHQLDVDKRNVTERTGYVLKVQLP
jgi:ureidoglycolate lyase